MRVAFLYTLASNVPLFAPYIESFVIASSRGSAGTRSSDDVSISHHVQEQLLTDARTMQTKGDERRVTKQVHQAIQDIIEKDDPTIIICTCSTIGDMAENFTATDDEKSKSSIKILRVDRPVANIAVHSYAQIHVLAALESTIKPTIDLLQECAAEKSQQPMPIVHTTVVPKAWSHLQQGDAPGYAQAVATFIFNKYGTKRNAIVDDVVIVLAQASMSPAVELLSREQLAQCPRILTSPASCMEYLTAQLT